MLTIRLKLDQHELEALRQAAAQELRLPPDQARHIVRQELARRGLLTFHQPDPTPPAAPAQRQAA